jgi:hypothetical protein
MRLAVCPEPMLEAGLRIVLARAMMHGADHVAIVIEALDAPDVALFRKPHVDRVDMGLLAIRDVDPDDLQGLLRWRWFRACSAPTLADSEAVESTNRRIVARSLCKTNGAEALTSGWPLAYKGAP